MQIKINAKMMLMLQVNLDFQRIQFKWLLLYAQLSSGNNIQKTEHSLKCASGKIMVTFILFVTKDEAHSIPRYPPPRTVASPPTHDCITLTSLEASAKLRK